MLTSLKLILPVALLVTSASAFAAAPSENDNDADKTEQVKVGEGFAPGEALKQYTIDVSALAKGGAYDHYMSRPDIEIQLLNSTNRAVRGNVLMDGERGAGKTALVEQAARILPADYHVFMLRLSDVIGNAIYRGEFEGRVSAIIRDMKAYKGKAILFIDEAHVIFLNEQYRSAAQDLKNALSRNEFRLWLATTTEEARLMDKDPAFQDRFQLLNVPVPTVTELLTFARMLKAKMEVSHGWQVLDSALRKAVDIALRFYTDQSPARAAEDLIDQTVARLKSEKQFGDKAMRALKAELIVLNSNLISLQSDLKLMKSSDPERVVIEIELGRLKQEIQEKKDVVSRADAPQLRQRLVDAQAKAAELLKNGDLSEGSRLKFSEIPNLEKLISDAGAGGVTESHDGIVQASDIARTAHEQKNFMMESLMGSIGEQTANFSKNAIIDMTGQEALIQNVQEGLDLYRSGLQNNSRTPFSILVNGDGSELATTIARRLLSDASRVVELDFAQFTQSNSDALLLGSPPGYVGFEEAGLLVKAVKGRGELVFLIKNFEMGHPVVQQIIASILKKGSIVDNSGRPADFRHASFVIETKVRLPKMSGEGLRQKISSILNKDVVENVTVVSQMNVVTYDQAKLIVARELEIQKISLKQKKNIDLTIEDSVVRMITDMTFSTEAGATFITPTVNRSVLSILVKLINRGQAKAGDKVELAITKSNNNSELLTAKVNGVLNRTSFVRLAKSIKEMPPEPPTQAIEVERAAEDLSRTSSLEREGKVDTKASAKRSKK